MEAQGAPAAGVASRSATAVVLLLLGLTLVLIVLAFPAGIYAVFNGGLSSQYTAGSFVPTYLWVGPTVALLPFPVPIGGLFVLLLAIYAGMFALGFTQAKRPLQAVDEALHTGVGGLLSSPFFVIIVSIGFLNFTALVVLGVTQAVAGSPGNPFSNVDPLLEFGSLTFAPLRETIGFRVVLIGLVALVLSMGKPLREALKSLWRPSAAYEGLAVGGATSLIIWAATAASAATFGVCHVTCGGGGGWEWAKVPEAVWGGIVLGYVYVRYGLHVAVLAHWGVDYMWSVFAFFGQSAYGIPVNSTTQVFALNYLFYVDMLLLFGVVSFLLVVYLGIRRVVAGRARREPILVDKEPAWEGAAEP